ncbi:ATP-binding SpoIIE family protein phosphatase [Streptomyces olivaceoviridis]|uniref:ATP-binding SpoIIE family protein phosphatase n=1 Tax=Streptomyces olivaceoviridis TaxID=1921 RepID=UPI00339F1315
MVSEIDAFLHSLSESLRPQVNESAAALLRRMGGELPELWEDDDRTALTREEANALVTAFLDMLDQGRKATEIKIPNRTLQVSRMSARRGIPLRRLLRAFHVGHLPMMQYVQQEAARRTSDCRLLNEVTLRLMATGFDYIDRASQQIVAAYQAERNDWLQRRLNLTDAASRRIGTTLNIARTAQELAEVGAEDFADLVTVDLLYSALHEEQTRHPRSAEPLLVRIAQFPESGRASLPTGLTHTYAPNSEPAHALNTGQPLLLDLSAPHSSVFQTLLPEREAPTDASGFHSMLLVPLQARGRTIGLVNFYRDRTETPFDEDDRLLAQQVAARAAVSIDNARRYTSERRTALTLQRSLLPRRLVAHSALETAFRYLPSSARAGVGGDWYDVIPLSGARVALVMGDVVGRGLQASVTMGRLRTAVRAFAEIDLMPDELLTHLDDVVIRLQREEGRSDAELSATCLYAVYDPVSRSCSMASAGHVLPVVGIPMTADNDGKVPDRSVGLPDMPVGPPLGLGGYPFETAEIALPEGSVLALYTDGLIEGRTQDVDTALRAMSDIVAASHQSPNGLCDQLLTALLPVRPTDDVALLVARTAALDPDHVAILDFPSTPEAVARCRTFTTDRLTSWGLEALSFTTELMVSELVTNAIRYGKSPIQLRLIYQTTLTCEVSDTSSTAPYLRRAHTYDEGGRGLLLVAQLSDRWGTRHNRDGKVIWAEQLLPTPDAP